MQLPCRRIISGDQKPFLLDGRTWVNVGFRTDRGIDKKSNEDSLHVDTERGLYIVADGMGGHNGGEIASHIAVQQIASCLAQGPDLGEETSKMLEQAVARANKAIYVMAASDPW